jgi:hypothetical protein
MVLDELGRGRSCCWRRASDSVAAMSGLRIFNSVQEALRAGYEIPRPAVPDSEGFLHARIMTAGGWAVALVSV